MTSFQIISPVDNSVYAERRYATGDQIEKTLVANKSAFEQWKQTDIEQRAEICRKVVAYFNEQADKLGEEITWQMGRPVRYAAFELKKGFTERAEYMINAAEQALRHEEVSDKAGFKRYIKKEPLGPVLVLAPWNYPYLTAVNAVIPAIMAGNTVILKHAEQTALCAEHFSKAFEAAGLPDGVFRYLHINHEQVAEVIKDPRIAYVAFTGSVEGGHAVHEAVGSRFINAGLEMGGKDPAYVAADADLGMTVENLVDGAFFNSGQSCCGVERIYVHQSHFDAFLESFVALTKTYLLGNPLFPETTLGPMVRKSNAEKVRYQIDMAIKSGAKQLISEHDFPSGDLPYLAPQVLVNVDHEMLIMREETFGPAVGIMPVMDDREAIRMMNDSPYGLTASIWTKDMERAISIGDQIDTGTWFMNRCDYLDPELAWTGVKNSGKGCTLSSLGYDYLTRPKSYHLKY